MRWFNFHKIIQINLSLFILITALCMFFIQKEKVIGTIGIIYVEKDTNRLLLSISMMEEFDKIWKQVYQLNLKINEYKSINLAIKKKDLKFIKQVNNSQSHLITIPYCESNKSEMTYFINSLSDRTLKRVVNIELLYRKRFYIDLLLHGSW
jgi:hypothetical protein